MKILFHLSLLFLAFSLICPNIFARDVTIYSVLKHHIVNSPKYAAIVIDKRNEKVLYSSNKDEKRYPASLTKLMTLYIVFNKLQTGEISMQKRMTVSKHAASMPPVILKNLKKGDTIIVADAINALIVRSANNVAVVLAEEIAESEAKFAKMMNKAAKKLGMHNTNFTNASGLPNKQQFSTANDMLKLALAIQKQHKRYYHLFKKTSMVFKNRRIQGHNNVLVQYKGATGLKTGFTIDSGFNLITSTHNKDKEILAVVMGGKSAYSRDKHMISLLDYAHSVMRKNQNRITSNIFSVLHN